LKRVCCLSIAFLGIFSSPIAHCFGSIVDQDSNPEAVTNVEFSEEDLAALFEEHSKKHHDSDDRDQDEDEEKHKHEDHECDDVCHNEDFHHHDDFREDGHIHGFEHDFDHYDHHDPWGHGGKSPDDHHHEHEDHHRHYDWDHFDFHQRDEHHDNGHYERKKEYKYKMILEKDEVNGKISVKKIIRNRKELVDISGYTFVLIDIETDKKIAGICTEDFPVEFNDLKSGNYKIEIYDENDNKVCSKNESLKIKENIIREEEKFPEFKRWLFVEVKSHKAKLGSKKDFIWVGIAVNKGFIEKGSKFHVKLIDKDSDPEEFEKHMKNYDGDYKDPEHMVFYEIGITKPDGTEYHDLNTRAKIYVQIPEGWDKGDLEAVYVSEEKDEQFQEYYINIPGRGDCLVYETTHFSPYTIIDKSDNPEDSSPTVVKEIIPPAPVVAAPDPTPAPAPVPPEKPCHCHNHLHRGEHYACGGEDHDYCHNVPQTSDAWEAKAAFGFSGIFMIINTIFNIYQAKHFAKSKIKSEAKEKIRSKTQIKKLNKSKNKKKKKGKKRR